MTKIVYNVDLHVPTEEMEEFIRATQLIFDCILKLLIEPPFYKLYPNKVYRDLKRRFTVSKIIVYIVLCHPACMCMYHSVTIDYN